MQTDEVQNSRHGDPNDEWKEERYFTASPARPTPFTEKPAIGASR
ncbi:hypothetical protein GJA_526 [Janthinobacterium agaricidamnosum NBRC 102515 = DSM 9628]|uniref:Uncharacterized protein n=1 Tax=Janthinobacterium agaricidamnosum NBRC 102515 = DSM 9628 TaxID=1349767 RepID=W0V1N4_9BURK|nr:hypothetical protein GJA_526 [Janthinobacterium agaricidamnosum NBRC 102515 = DSM 9628]